MKGFKKPLWLSLLLTIVLALTVILVNANSSVSIEEKEPGDDEGAGNNLSYPVVWAEGVAKVLRGTEGVVTTDGVWYYWWGTEGTSPDVTPLSCLPSPSNEAKCENDTDPGQGWVKAYVQKDIDNEWQASAIDGSLEPVIIDWVDWGDNLESNAWKTTSKVRTEVVLFKDFLELETPLVEYDMRHVAGLGTDEQHGMAVGQDGEVIMGPGTQATVYSPCARLTIQKMQRERDNPLLSARWDPASAEWVGDFNAPLFNQAVYEAADGTGYYNAEINVKGRVIFGYTWDAKSMNEGEGDYRITFSFDEACGTNEATEPVNLNTSLVFGVTEILLPVEEEVEPILLAEPVSDGGTAMIDCCNNLTFIDIRLTDSSSGGGGSGPYHTVYMPVTTLRN